MKLSIALSLLISFAAYSYPTYTAYSGAPGSKGTCASSCHGSGTGTITVTGFPTSYIPGTTYTMTVSYSSGSTISNFNASARKGTTSSGAGTFAAGTRTAVYTVSGYENGIRASSNSISSATFNWTAPAAGTGNVTLYVSGLQGSKGGPNTKIVRTSTETVTSSANDYSGAPESFSLSQNYPNPFNPSTTISFNLPARNEVTLKVYNSLGNEVAVLLNKEMEAGTNSVSWNASGLPSGIYFYTLQSGRYCDTKKLTLLK